MAARFGSTFGSTWEQKKAIRSRMEAEKLAARKAKYSNNGSGIPRAAPEPIVLRESSPPPAKRARSEEHPEPPVEPPVEPEKSVRTMLVPFDAIPTDVQRHAHNSEEVLERKLATLCRAHYKQPYGLKSVWADRRINVIVVQMIMSYGRKPRCVHGLISSLRVGPRKRLIWPTSRST